MRQQRRRSRLRARADLLLTGHAHERRTPGRLAHSLGRAAPRSRTVEWFARLNEEERRNIIELSHLSDKNLDRLKAMLELDGETWEAGIKLATRSAWWTRVTKRFPALVLSLAALIVALNTIWSYAGPWLRMLVSGGKP